MDEARDNILDHYERPRKQGALQGATAIKRIDNPVCGDRVTLYLRVEDDVIDDIGFEGRGCIISQASASMLCEELVGKSVAEAQAFDDHQMLALLGTTLAPGRIKCATLGVRALHQGLGQTLGDQ